VDKIGQNIRGEKLARPLWKQGQKKKGEICCDTLPAYIAVVVGSVNHAVAGADGGLEKKKMKEKMVGYGWLSRGGSVRGGFSRTGQFWEERGREKEVDERACKMRKGLSHAQDCGD
jgi:hypothetical protein